MTAFEYSAEDARRTVEVAYLGLRAAGIEPDEVAIADEALRVRRMVSDASLAMKVQLAVPILATVDSVEFEESSKRYVVRYTPVKDATEQEHVRSPRMDTSLGKKVKGLFERDLVGHLAIVYRLNEEAGRDLARAQGYRVAPYIADLGKKGA